MKKPCVPTEATAPKGSPGRAAAGQRGALLVEAVIAILIFTLVGSAALVGLSTTLNFGGKQESQAVAENLGRNQMEYVFSSEYLDPPATYPAVVSPPGYSTNAVAQTFVPGDANIEKVVVTVSRDGLLVMVLESLRLKE